MVAPNEGEYIVLISEVFSFQELKCMQQWQFG